MGKIVEHFISGLQQDCEKIRQDKEDKASDSDARKKNETKLYQLLSELIETERKYVRDLEEVCSDYSPLIGDSFTCSSLDRKKIKKVIRNRSHIQLRSDGLKKTCKAKFHENMASDMEQLRPSRQELRQMLGNLEDIKDYHKKVLLPKMEEAVGDARLIRALFYAEKPKLSRKYGRYCINSTRSSIIITHNIKFFSIYQFNNGLKLRIDAMLIKPIQRLTRYHMFLTSISKTCKELGFNEASANVSVACDYVTSAARHTNTMMWIGKMENCPLDLSGQGQLLKQGQVLTRSLTGSVKKGRKWSSSSQKSSTCHLFLFQQTIVLCKTAENVEDQNNSHLSYIDHISVNQLRVRDTIGDDLNTFEVHKLENLNVGMSVMGDTNKSDTKSGVIMRIECQSEDIKDDWVRAINIEVKQLRCLAKTLSSQMLMINL